jgi:prepilin-type N-terminal cleavage/methylation domain-containing protein
MSVHLAPSRGVSCLNSCDYVCVICEPEAGFTLIELMVVLLIIAILLAIAIPTFLGVTSSANDRAAQSNLTNGLTEATAQYQSAGQTLLRHPGLLSSSAPEYTWTGSGVNNPVRHGQPNCISVDPDDAATSGDNQAVVLAAMSKTGPAGGWPSWRRRRPPSPARDSSPWPMPRRTVPAWR